MGSDAQRNVVFFELPRCFCADLGAVAASHDIGHPVLHHDGKLGAFIALAIGGYRLPCVFKTVAVETMMNGNPVESLDPRNLGELVNEPCRKENLRSAAGRAVRADELKSFSRRGMMSVTRVSRTETDL